MHKTSFKTTLTVGIMYDQQINKQKYTILKICYVVETQKVLHHQAGQSY